MSKRYKRHQRLSTPFGPLSLGYNAKIDCPTFNLPPWLTCKGMPCYGSCYAMGATGTPDKPGPRFKSCQQAWEGNFRLIHGSTPSRDAAAVALIRWLRGDSTASGRVKRGPDPACEYFRWLSAGELTHQTARVIHHVVQDTPDTRHLLFTKRIPLALAADLHTLNNLTLIESCWPGVDPTPGFLPRAHVVPRDGDPLPGTLLCPGSCADCRECWIQYPRDISFRFHGSRGEFPGVEA